MQLQTLQGESTKIKLERKQNRMFPTNNDPQSLSKESLLTEEKDKNDIKSTFTSRFFHDACLIYIIAS